MGSLFERGRRRGAWTALGLLLLLTLVVVGLPTPAHAATSYPTIVGTITGPSIVGRALQANYIVNGSGGPAQAANGTQVGNITFNATLSGTNVTTASISPPTGILVNGGVLLRFTAPNITEVVTLQVELTSSYAGANVSMNFTSKIHVVAPYVLGGTLGSGPHDGHRVQPDGDRGWRARRARGGADDRGEQLVQFHFRLRSPESRGGLAHDRRLVGPRARSGHLQGRVATTLDGFLHHEPAAGLRARRGGRDRRLRRGRLYMGLGGGRAPSGPAGPLGPETNR